MPTLKNPKHEKFAQELAKGNSADDAYRVAGYSPDRAHASRLAAKGNILARVDEILQKGALKAEITVERILRELGAIGFADIRKIVKWRGNVTVIGEDPDSGEPATRAFNEVALVDSNAIDDETAAGIAEISQSKDGALKVKLHDKQAALLALGKHLGMFIERAEVDVTHHAADLTDADLADIARRGRDGAASQAPGSIEPDRLH